MSDKRRYGNPAAYRRAPVSGNTSSPGTLPGREFGVVLTGILSIWDARLMVTIETIHAFAKQLPRGARAWIDDRYFWEAVDDLKRKRGVGGTRGRRILYCEGVKIYRRSARLYRDAV